MHQAIDASEGVFAMSVVSEMVGTGVQNLRLYERRGLVTPKRTLGGTRLYSQDDVDRMRRIVALLTVDGLNLAGVAMVLQLESRIAELEVEQS